MRNIAVIASLLWAFLAALPLSSAQSSSPSQGQKTTLVVVFKDGQQRSYPISEVARIEFQTSPTTASNVGQGRFLGEWKVGDCRGGYFRITLDRDGVARKTLGPPHGTWTVVDGEARANWEDGWRDTIRKAGRRYEKSAYSPGTSYAEGPSCTASAESTDHKPI
jgi:hypothetical protein